MSTATLHDRPLRVVYSPEDAQDVREHLDRQRGAFRAFLKAKGALSGLLQTLRDGAAAVWSRLTGNRFLRYASRACGWTPQGVRQAGRGLSRPGVRSGLLWAALSQTGTAIIRAVGSTVMGGIRRVLRPLAKVGSWLLRLTGPGRRVVDKLEELRSTVSTRVERIISDVRESLAPHLRRDGLIMQTVQSLLGARAISGLAKTVLPMPWRLLVRVAASLTAIPAGVRRTALAFLKDLFGVGTQDEPTPPPAAPQAGTVTDLTTERAHRQDQDVSDLDEVVPTLQRYPAKKAQHKRR